MRERKRTHERESNDVGIDRGRESERGAPNRVLKFFLEIKRKASTFGNDLLRNLRKIPEGVDDPSHELESELMALEEEACEAIAPIDQAILSTVEAMGDKIKNAATTHFDLEKLIEAELEKWEKIYASSQKRTLRERVEDTSGADLEAMQMMDTLRNLKSRIISDNERAEIGANIDIEVVREKSERLIDYLDHKIKTHDVVILGDVRQGTDHGLRLIADHLDVIKKAGVTTIGLPMDENHQKAVDLFLETGKFFPGDDPEIYERMRLLVAQEKRLLKEWKESKEKEEEDEKFDKYHQFAWERRSHPFVRYGLDHYYPLLKKIRTSGLRAQCMENNQRPLTGFDISQEIDERVRVFAREKGSEPTSEEQTKIFETVFNEQKELTDRTMLQHTKDTVAAGEKLLIYTTPLHAAKASVFYARFGIERSRHRNCAEQLADDKAISSFSIHIDWDFDEMVGLAAKDRLNSVMYSTLQNEPLLPDESIGFDLTSDVFKEKPSEPLPFDGYVRVV